MQIEPDIAEAQINLNIIGNGQNGRNVSGSSFPSSSAPTEVFDSMYSGLTRKVIFPVCILLMSFFLIKDHSCFKNVKVILSDTSTISFF